MDAVVTAIVAPHLFLLLACFGMKLRAQHVVGSIYHLYALRVTDDTRYISWPIYQIGNSKVQTRSHLHSLVLTWAPYRYLARRGLRGQISLAELNPQR